MSPDPPHQGDNNDDWDESNWDDDIPPNAGNLSTSLQGLTYDFERAVADVVDNSIAHGQAENIWIIISNGDDDDDVSEPYIAIIDDGVGMDKGQLRSALRYGAESDPNELNLGRFGLGMKTASTSQCHVLTVCSRQTITDDFNALSWDLNFLRTPMANGRWIPLKRDISNLPNRCMSYIQQETGTVVHWSDLSKMMPKLAQMQHYHIQQSLGSKIKKLRAHLGMVFHRFIDGETVHFPRKKLKIWINDEPVQSWDPFAKWHQASRPHKLDEQNLELEYQIEDPMEGRVSLSRFGMVMSVSARILPRQNEFFDQEVNGVNLTKDQVHELVGQGKWLQSQGIYFYRLDRIIQAGRWSGILSPDEKTKLARVSIDVGREWDDELQLNVTKSYVKLPSELVGTKQAKKDLRRIFGNVRSRAKSVYEDHGNEPLIPPPGGFPSDDVPIPTNPPTPPVVPTPPKPPTPTVPPVQPPQLPIPIPPSPGTPSPSVAQQARDEMKSQLFASCETKSEEEILRSLLERIGE